MSNERAAAKREFEARRKSSLLQRLGTRVARRAMKAINGYDVAFLDDMVTTLGIAGMQKWAGQLGDASVRAEQEWGAMRGQHAIAFVALLNGCPFCSVAHLFAGNLALFAESGALFPIDERDVPAIQELADPELLRKLEAKLHAYPETVAMFRRLYALKFDAPDDAQAGDELMKEIIALWDIIVECSILRDDLEPEDIDPMSDLARDRDLRRRYRQAREG